MESIELYDVMCGRNVTVYVSHIVALTNDKYDAVHVILDTGYHVVTNYKDIKDVKKLIREARYTDAD